MERLPRDVLTLIMAQVLELKGRNILPLLLTCKEWTAVARKLAYKRVFLDDRRRIDAFRDTIIDSVCSNNSDVSQLVREIRVDLDPERTGVTKHDIEVIRESILCILPNLPCLESFHAVNFTSGYSEIACLHRNNATSLTSLAVTLTSCSKGKFQLLGKMVALRSLHIDIVITDVEWAHPIQHCLCLPNIVELSWTCVDVELEEIDEDMLAFVAACRFANLRKLSLSMWDLSDEGAQDLMPFLQRHSPLSELNLRLNQDAYMILAPYIVHVSHLCLRGGGAPPKELLHHGQFPRTLELFISSELISVHRELTQFFEEMAAVDLTPVGTRDIRIRVFDRPFSWSNEGDPPDITRFALMAVLLPLAVTLYNKGIRILDTNDRDVAWLVHDMQAQLSV